MSKLDVVKTRYYVQWDSHAKHMCTVLCSLMEHQSLVDIAICCGTNTIHAHKCVLAANSPYFREQLEKNAGTEQIIMTGLDFAIVKSLIEFMYCGETNILDDNLKYMIAAAKFFQMRGLQTLVSDHQTLQYEAESIHIPAPVFLPKKPKYPNAYRPINAGPSPAFPAYKQPLPNDPYVHRRIKRKFVRTEAEKACAKEAAASRLALEALQKELATSQMSSFVIEESCTETTVENFIPHSEESFIENINHIEGVPLQVVNYDDLNNSILTQNQIIDINKTDNGNANKEKLKRILGANFAGDIEIMYRTNEGEIVNVTSDVLQNLSGDVLQYQIVDENGQIRELREFQGDQSCTNTYEATPLPLNQQEIIEQPYTEPAKSFPTTLDDASMQFPANDQLTEQQISNGAEVEVASSQDHYDTFATSFDDKTDEQTTKMDDDMELEEAKPADRDKQDEIVDVVNEETSDLYPPESIMHECVINLPIDYEAVDLTKENEGESPYKKMQLSPGKTIEDEAEENYCMRKTRSSTKASELNTSSELKELTVKPRRVMPNRKKKTI